MTKTRIVALALVVFAASANAMVAAAHDDPSHQIDELSRRIAATPADATLYVRRAELYRERCDWQPALVDLQAANELDPVPDAVGFLAARILLDADDPEAALPVIERFVAAHPDRPGGHLLHARILAKIPAGADAVREFTRGIDMLIASGAKPQPDDYLERANLQASLGDVDGAVRGLDEGAAALGGAISLRVRAADLEIGRGRWDAALERIAAIEAVAHRKEPWMARRADILRRAGRPDEEAALRNRIAQAPERITRR